MLVYDMEAESPQHRLLDCYFDEKSNADHRFLVLILEIVNEEFYCNVINFGSVLV